MQDEHVDPVDLAVRNMQQQLEDVLASGDPEPLVEVFPEDLEIVLNHLRLLDPYRQDAFTLHELQIRRNLGTHLSTNAQASIETTILMKLEESHADRDRGSDEA